MPLLTRKRVMAAKAEGTDGTAETLSASEAVMNVYDTNFAGDLPVFAREGQGASFSKRKSVQTTQAGTVTFASDIIGGSSAPYWASVLLPLCGFVGGTGDAYTPSTAQTGGTGTIGVYQDGLLKRIAGAMGKVRFVFTDGEPLRAEWEFMGKYVAPSDTAILAPTYETTIPPRFAGATLTIGAYTPLISNLTIEIDNEIKLREDVTDATGFKTAVIVNRRVVVSMDAEADLVANYSAYATLLAGTTAVLDLTVGTTGNQLDIDIPVLQLVGVEDGDREGLVTHNLTFEAQRNAAAGDDEIVITTS